MTTGDFYALTHGYNETYKCAMCHGEYNVTETPIVDVPPLYNYFSKHYIICWNCSTKIINGDKQAVEWFNKHIRGRSDEE